MCFNYIIILKVRVFMPIILNDHHQSILTTTEENEIIEIFKNTDIDSLPAKYLNNKYASEIIMRSYCAAYPEYNEYNKETKQKMWTYYVEDTFFYKYLNNNNKDILEILINFIEYFKYYDDKILYNRLIEVLIEFLVFELYEYKKIKYNKYLAYLNFFHNFPDNKEYTFLLNYKTNKYEKIFKLKNDENYFNKLENYKKIRTITFQNISFQDEIKFKKLNSINHIVFKNCCFKNNLLFSCLTIEKVEFEDCIFEKNTLLRFFDVKIKFLLHFQNCIFRNKNNLLYGVIPLEKANIEFKDVELEDTNLTFYSSKKSKLEFKKSESIFLLNVKSGLNSKILLNETVLPSNFSMEKSSFENCELNFKGASFLEGTQFINFNKINFNKINLKESSLNMSKTIIKCNLMFEDAICEDSKEIDFYEAKIGGHNDNFISFNRSNFKNISFLKTSFLSNTNFEKVIFNTASFSNSLWGYEEYNVEKEPINTNSSKSISNLDIPLYMEKKPINIKFSKSIFNRDISFNNSKFNCNTVNDSYHIDFNSIVCKENFSMKGVEINKNIKKSRYKIRINFNQSVFNKFNITEVINPENIKELNCSEVDFKKVPLLENEGFNGVLNLRNSDIPVMDIDNLIKNINLKKLNKSEIMKMKLLAKDSGDIDNELYLNSIELTKRKGFLNKLSSLLYQLLSNSGQSFWRPIIWLCYWDMVFINYYYEKLKNNTIDHFIQFQDVISFTLLNNVPFITILRDQNKNYLKIFYAENTLCTPNTQNTLTAITNMCNGLINEGLLSIPASHSLLIFIHLSISFSLVFLIGLGIRNKFRLK